MNYKDFFSNPDVKFISRKSMKEWIVNDPTPRTTVSFYRYVNIEDPLILKDELYEKFFNLEVLGRIYLAHEGINAQMSVPTVLYKKFLSVLNKDKRFKKMPIKIAVEDNGKSFYKLGIKVRKKIVADGLNDNEFDTTNVGKHLSAEEFNKYLEDPNSVVVDMRNHYESEIGHFENAICPDVDTFREELPLVEKLLEDKKDKKILLYCTGGVRCEKASAYLKHKGFKDVNQLLGGIIDYVRQIKSKNLETKFIGKNFVFDERLGERITEEVISKCHQCLEPCDLHTNCKNDDCHLLFIQCDKCRDLYTGCCSEQCQTVAALPIEEQRFLRKGKKKKDALSVYKSRLRPKLYAVNSSNKNSQ